MQSAVAAVIAGHPRAMIDEVSVVDSACLHDLVEMLDALDVGVSLYEALRLCCEAGIPG